MEDKIILETNRLILREYKIEDFNDIKKVLSDKENMKFYNIEFDDNMVKYWIDKQIERYRIFNFGVWAIVLKDTNEVIGDCGISMQVIDNIIRPEIGYHIRRDLHNLGIAKEACIAVRDYCFINLSFNEIYSYMDKDNIASCNTALSYGAHHVKDYIDKDGNNTSYYMLTKEEWNRTFRK